MMLSQSKIIKFLFSTFILFVCVQANSAQSLQDLKNQLQEADQSSLQSAYTIAINLPSNWVALPVTSNSEGYNKTFVTKSETNPNNRTQAVNIHFFRNTKLDADTAVTELVKRDKESNTFKCKIVADAIDKDANSATFTLTHTDCQLMNVADSIQVHKVFSMSDGMYTVSYSAQSGVVSKKKIEQLTSIIKSAEIVKNN